ncbi:hypothetical protein ACSQ67_007291 [Phaseolus vulgaris]
MILMNDESNGFSLSADVHVLPATHVSYDAGLQIKAYINSTATPIATILFKGTIIGNSLSPAVSSFSSRGPNLPSPEILNFEHKLIVDETLHTADVFATGSGHVNPSRANDPGLVYDITADDYIPYLCGLGYSDTEVGIIAHRTVKCSQTPSIPEGQLNYPSFSVSLGSPKIFTRTVTNVGEANSSYEVTVKPPEGVDVKVKPNKLYFSEANQKETYSVSFSRIDAGNETVEYAQGFLKWVSSEHTVSSPILVYFV